MAIAALDPAAAALISWAGESDTLPAAHTPATLVSPVGSVATHPLSRRVHPTELRSMSFGTNVGPTNTTMRGTTVPSASSMPVSQLSSTKVDKNRFVNLD